MTTVESAGHSETQDSAVPRELPGFARIPVLSTAAVVVVILIAVASRYGWTGDELYYRVLSRHLNWSFADVPPLIPALARLCGIIAPDSLVVFRIPSALFTGAGIVVAALTAREFGGRTRAQVVTAVLYAVSPILLSLGHVMGQYTLDPLCWSVLIWLLVRWIRLRVNGVNGDRLLLWFGVTLAVTVQVRLLIVFFLAIALVALLVAGPRDLLGRPMLWAGALIAAVSAAPIAIWQAMHGWPMLTDGAVDTSRVTSMGGVTTWIPYAVLYVGVPTGAVLLVYGGWQLMRSSWLRPWRFLGWTLLGLIVVFLAIGLPQYYFDGMYPVAWAAAATAIQQGRMPWWSRWVAGVPAMVLASLVAASGLPWQPASEAVNGLNTTVGDSIGWQELTQTVNTAYTSLPVQQRAHTAIIAQEYDLAGGIDLYAKDYGLPLPYAAVAGYYDIAQPPASDTTVVFAGGSKAELDSYFTSVRQVGTVHTAIAKTATNGQPVWLCSGQRESWNRLWPAMKHSTYSGVARQ